MQSIENIFHNLVDLILNSKPTLDLVNLMESSRFLLLDEINNYGPFCHSQEARNYHFFILIFYVITPTLI
jgi:hypothetical protein